MTVIVDYTGLDATQRKHVLGRFERSDLRVMGKIPGNAKLQRMRPLKDEYDLHLVMGAALAFVPARPLRPPVTAGSEVDSQGQAKYF